MDLRSLMVDMDAPALRSLSRTFAEIAAEARERARVLDAWEKTRRDAAASIARLDGLPDLVAAEIAAGGGDCRQAAALVAVRESVPVETVEHHWRRWCRSRTAAAIEARRVMIVQLALKGRRNDEIAKATGVSARTVERALKGINWGKMPTAA